MFRDDIDLWILHLIRLLDYDDCLFIPMINNIVKFSCRCLIVQNCDKNAQKFICLYIINPAIIALQKLVPDKLLLYSALVQIETELRLYNIRHEMLCKILSMLTKFIIDTKYCELINDSHGKAPAHLLRLSINTLSPYIIKLTNGTNSTYWTGLFNSLLRIKIEYSISNTIINMEIASTTQDHENYLPLLITEASKVCSMVSMLEAYISVSNYSKRAEALKNELTAKYSAENLVPIMVYYKMILIDLASHKYHNMNFPSMANNYKLKTFDNLTKTAFIVTVPNFIAQLLKSYMLLMLKLPSINNLCINCKDCYIQQHLHFIYEMLEYSHKMMGKIGEWMGKDPTHEFREIFETIKSLIVFIVGSEHILSMNWFSISKKLAPDLSNLLHRVAIRYSPCQSMIRALLIERENKKYPKKEPLAIPLNTGELDESIDDLLAREGVSLMLDGDWVETRVMHESQLLLFHHNGLLVAIVDLRFIIGAIKHPPYGFSNNYDKEFIVKLVTSEWNFGGIEKLNGLSHQPYVILSVSSAELRDQLVTAFNNLSNSISARECWNFPKYRHFDAESESFFNYESIGESSGEEYCTL